MIWIDYRLLFATALSLMLAGWAVLFVEAQQTESQRPVDKVASPSDTPPAGTKDTPSPAPSSTRASPAATDTVVTPADPAASSVSGTKLVTSLTIFVLAIFVGFEVITKVPPTLHTPLMSGSNAISGITLVGAVVIAGLGYHFASFIGFLAVVMATVNVVGGFTVTHRMLSMFKGKQNR